jgi:homoserine dehydrogenase
MPRSPLIVLKFGGSVLESEDSLPVVVHEIYRWLREGWRVIAVVSAIGGTTDRLLSRARRLTDEPDPESLALLLSTGELGAAALLGVALDRAGVPAHVLDSARIGLHTAGPILDAEPIGLDNAAVESALADRPVAVVPGFIGRTHGPAGRPSLLGRGGSDLTALFLASQLGAARCRLIKDVDGLYERDPAERSDGREPARRFRLLSWDDALGLDGRIVQHKAVRFARQRRLGFEVGAIGAKEATVVGDLPREFASGPGRRGEAPLRVGLLGLGVVGLGVYRALALQRDLFEVVGIAVRDIEKHAGDGVPRHLLTTDPWRVVTGECDVIVEAIGGREPAAELVRAALDLRRSVVTANKAVVASDAESLETLAAARRVEVRYSAAVGGAVPVLEAVARAAGAGPILAIEGVLNGTSNFVLGRLEDGSTLEDAITEARRRGLAEADPSHDLDGTDAAHKLAIIARVGFGLALDPEAVERTAITAVEGPALRAGAGGERVIKHVASLRLTPDGPVARVAPAALAWDHPLAGARGEENRVLIHSADSEPVLVCGRGAGRWPTTESVVADLLDIARARRATPPVRRERSLA